MGGRPDAREGRDGVMEEASGDLCVEVGGRTEIGDPSVGLLSTVFAWRRPGFWPFWSSWAWAWASMGLGTSTPIKEHAHPSSAHLLQRDEPSITMHRFWGTVLSGLDHRWVGIYHGVHYHVCIHTLDSLHLWHARNALRLLLAFSSLTNDRIPCISCEGLEYRLFLADADCVQEECRIAGP